MKKLLYVFAAVALVSACTADLEDKQIVVGNGNSANDKILNGAGGCVSGSIVVRFAPSAESRLAECATRSGATRTGISGVDAILDEVSGYSVEPLYVVTEKNREKVYEGGYHLWYELRFDESSDMENVATRLAKVSEIERVQYVHRIKRVGAPKAVAVELSSDDAPVTRAINNPFNDTYAVYQWGVENLGSGGLVTPTVTGLAKAVAGADVNAVPAWKLCAGDPSIVVAVLDEGVQNTHEDLKNNMWINEAELNGQAGVDDDGNGYKDDIYGFNFVTMTGTHSWTKSGDSGHGTHVAGIVAAENNNGIGVCGVAGGSGKGDGVKIMSIQIFSGDDGVTSTGLVRAFQYAADNGAYISQNSWGYISAEAVGYPSYYMGPSNDKAYKQQFSSEAGAIDYFVKNAGSKNGPMEGGLVIFAAGNDNATLPGYPGAYEPCIAVAAMSPSARPTYFTDHGIGTDIMAPGGENIYKNGEILSTIPTKFSVSGKPNYGLMQGTSQACPHVSGVAALGLSYAKKLGKHYTAKEFRSLLLSATNDVNPYLVGGMTLTFTDGSKVEIDYPSYKGKLGAGYVDAYKLLLQVEGTPCKVVKVGEQVDIDLSLYFGEGIVDAQHYSTNVSEEDVAAVGLTVGEYADGKISVKTTKVGAAIISVTMLVGGGSLDNNKKPYPTEVTRKFVVISKEGVQANGGWL